jgi:DNA polymerase III delta subunit
VLTRRGGRAEDDGALLEAMAAIDRQMKGESMQPSDSEIWFYLSLISIFCAAAVAFWSW